MTADFVDAARALLGEQPSGDSSAQLAERAVAAFDALKRHLARLLGEAGIALLFRRSLTLAAARFPWLRPVGKSADASGLQDALEQQDPVVIADAFTSILSVFVGLIEKLIGEPLVMRLVDEVWPGIFVRAAKDTP